MSTSGYLLERLAVAVRAASEAGASDVEVSHRGGTAGISRFANSMLTQAGVIEEPCTRVRVAVGDRIAAAVTDALEPDALVAAAKAAVAIAAHQPATAGFPGFATASAAPLGAKEAFVAATAAATPGDHVDALSRIFAHAEREQLLCAGALVTAARQIAVVTAGGLAVEHAFTEASLHLIALDGDASGYAAFVGGDVSRLDAVALADEAVTTAASSRDAVEIEPGPYDIVLSPVAVAELLEWMAMTSFAATTVLDGTSLLCGHQGQRVCGEEITIRDDPHVEHPSAIRLPFDAEGTPRRAVAYLDRGVAGEPATDRISAVRLHDGRGSSGHAAPLGDDLADGPSAAHLVMSPGDASREDLLSRVERGLYVTRFHYVNGLLDTRRATMTGMTRDGTFLIEHGRLGRAVKNLRFTESILGAFGRVGGVGRDIKAVQTHMVRQVPYLCPAMLLRDFHFTGRSR